MVHDITHPLICLYKNTQNKDFPLILIFGREPNNKSPYINEVGLYDFDESPKCAFWNIGYKLIGEINNLSARDFKEKCKSKASSIIGFTNSLCQPILSKIRNKNKTRQNIRPEKNRRTYR